jgi:hypothetical protein
MAVHNSGKKEDQLFKVTIKRPVIMKVFNGVDWRDQAVKAILGEVEADDEGAKVVYCMTYQAFLPLGHGFARVGVGQYALSHDDLYAKGLRGEVIQETFWHDSNWTPTRVMIPAANIDAIVEESA